MKKNCTNENDYHISSKRNNKDNLETRSQHEKHLKYPGQVEGLINQKLSLQILTFQLK